MVMRIVLIVKNGLPGGEVTRHGPCPGAIPGSRFSSFHLPPIGIGGIPLDNPLTNHGTADSNSLGDPPLWVGRTPFPTIPGTPHFRSGSEFIPTCFSQNKF